MEVVTQDIPVWDEDTDLFELAARFLQINIPKDYGKIFIKIYSN